MRLARAQASTSNERPGSAAPGTAVYHPRTPMRSSEKSGPGGPVPPAAHPEIFRLSAGAAGGFGLPRSDGRDRARKLARSRHHSFPRQKRGQKPAPTGSATPSRDGQALVQIEPMIVTSKRFCRKLHTPEGGSLFRRRSGSIIRRSLLDLHPRAITRCVI